MHVCVRTAVCNVGIPDWHLWAQAGTYIRNPPELSWIEGGGGGVQHTDLTLPHCKSHCCSPHCKNKHTYAETGKCTRDTQTSHYCTPVSVHLPFEGVTIKSSYCESSWPPHTVIIERFLLHCTDEERLEGGNGRAEGWGIIAKGENNEISMREGEDLWM